LFAEYTGAHPPLEINWSFENDRPVPTTSVASMPDPPVAESTPHVQTEAALQEKSAARPAFSSLWEFAVAVNRSEAAALAVAGNGATPDIPIEGPEVRKLLGTLWFRGVVPRLSEGWKARILDVLADSFPVPNHRVKRGKHVARFSELGYAELQEMAQTSVPDTVKADLDLLLTVGRLWGGEGLKRLRFTDAPLASDGSKLVSLFQGLRHGNGHFSAPDGRE
jgi:hypothetical protein